MDKAKAYDNLLSIIEKWVRVCEEEKQMTQAVNMPDGMDRIIGFKREARAEQMKAIVNDHKQYIAQVKREAEMPKQIKASGWSIKNDMRMPH